MNRNLFLVMFSLVLLASMVSCANSLLPSNIGDAGSERALVSGAIVNGLQWADTAGSRIQAHGGGIIKDGSYYYWFGENRKTDNTFNGVSCYRSSDLRSWEFRGNVLASTSATELNVCNIERPKVVYNASTGRYVMWMHYEDPVYGYGLARAAVASSPTIDGNYTYQGSFRPYEGQGITDHGRDGYMSRDCNLFVDSDGAGYFISSSNENMDLHLYRLTADYLGISTLVAKLFVGSQREAPVIFKRNGYYFLLTSGCTGWTPNQAKYSVSTSLASGWSALANVGDGNTFYSQPTSVVAVQGTAGTAYLYAGDRWAGAWSGKVNDSPYVWSAITFPSNTTMSMGWTNTLTISTSAGTITGANNSFAFTNQNSGKLLEVKSASTTDGAAIQQYTSNNGTNQKWKLNYDGAGYFYLTNVKSSKVMDVNSSSTADGVALIQWTSNGGANQKWLLTDLGGGKFTLTNKNSGKVAQVRGASTANSAVVEQSTANGSATQIWNMTVSN